MSDGRLQKADREKARQLLRRTVNGQRRDREIRKIVSDAGAYPRDWEKVRKEKGNGTA